MINVTHSINGSILTVTVTGSVGYLTLHINREPQTVSSGINQYNLKTGCYLVEVKDDSGIQHFTVICAEKYGMRISSDLSTITYTDSAIGMNPDPTEPEVSPSSTGPGVSPSSTGPGVSPSSTGPGVSPSSTGPGVSPWDSIYPFSKIRPCIINDKRKVIAYLDRSDYTKYEDGTPVISYDGDVCVEFPNFYYSYKIIGQEAELKFSAMDCGSLEGTDPWIPTNMYRGEVYDKIYIGAYFDNPEGKSTPLPKENTFIDQTTSFDYDLFRKSLAPQQDVFSVKQLAMLRILSLVRYKSPQHQKITGSILPENSETLLCYNKETKRDPWDLVRRIAGLEDVGGLGYYFKNDPQKYSTYDFAKQPETEKENGVVLVSPVVAGGVFRERSGQIKFLISTDDYSDHSSYVELDGVFPVNPLDGNCFIAGSALIASSPTTRGTTANYSVLVPSSGSVSGSTYSVDHGIWNLSTPDVGTTYDDPKHLYYVYLKGIRRVHYPYGDSTKFNVYYRKHHYTDSTVRVMVDFMSSGGEQVIYFNGKEYHLLSGSITEDLPPGEYPIFARLKDSYGFDREILYDTIIVHEVQYMHTPLSIEKNEFVTFDFTQTGAQDIRMDIGGIIIDVNGSPRQRTDRYVQDTDVKISMVFEHGEFYATKKVLVDHYQALLIPYKKSKSGCNEIHQIVDTDDVNYRVVGYFPLVCGFDPTQGLGIRLRLLEENGQSGTEGVISKSLFERTYSTKGDYTLTLKVMDTAGNIASMDVVKVHAVGPNAKLAELIYDQVIKTNRLSLDFTDTTGNDVTVDWGDDTTSIVNLDAGEVKTEHVFSTGQYTTTITVKGGYGTTDTDQVNYRYTAIYGVDIHPSGEMVYLENASKFKKGPEDWDGVYPFMAMKPVLLDDQGSTITYLDPNDFSRSSKGEDVSALAEKYLTMIEIPRFYQKITKEEGVVRVLICSEKPDSTWTTYHHYNGYSVNVLYIGTYLGGTVGGTFHKSAPNTKIAYDMDIPLDSVYSKVNMDSVTLLQSLFLLRFKTTNSSALGQGLRYSIEQTTPTFTDIDTYIQGSKSSGGMYDYKTERVKCFGIEGLWHDFPILLSGVYNNNEETVFIRPDGSQKKLALDVMDGYVVEVAGNNTSGFFPIRDSKEVVPLYYDWTHFHHSATDIYWGFLSGTSGHSGIFCLGTLGFDKSSVFSGKPYESVRYMFGKNIPQPTLKQGFVEKIPHHIYVSGEQSVIVKEYAPYYAIEVSGVREEQKESLLWKKQIDYPAEKKIRIHALDMYYSPYHTYEDVLTANHFGDDVLFNVTELPPGESLVIDCSKVQSGGLTIEWGDGSQSLVFGEKKASHIYTKDGVYEVTITADGKNPADPDHPLSNGGSFKQKINVTQVKCNYILSQTTGYAPMAVNIDMTKSIGSSAYVSSGYKNAMFAFDGKPGKWVTKYTYTEPGTYTLTMTVQGVRKTDVEEVVIRVLSPDQVMPKAQAVFTKNKETLLVDTTGSIGNMMEINWGDGTKTVTATGVTQHSHKYWWPDLFTVIVTAYGDNDTTSKIGYEMSSVPVYGFKLEDNTSFPVTHTFDSVGVTNWDDTSLFKSLKPCLFSPSQGVLHYLNPDNFKMEGIWIDEDFIETGPIDTSANGVGDVMIEIPQFFYRIHRSRLSVVYDTVHNVTNMNNADNCTAVEASYYKIGEDWVSATRYNNRDKANTYISAYHLSRDERTNSIRSVSGRNPVPMFYDAMKKSVMYRGFQLLRWQHVTIMQLLFLLRYKDYSAKKVIPYFEINASGELDSLGMNANGPEKFGFKFMGIDTPVSIEGGEWIDNIAFVEEEPGVFSVELDGKYKETIKPSYGQESFYHVIGGNNWGFFPTLNQIQVGRDPDIPEEEGGQGGGEGESSALVTKDHHFLYGTANDFFSGLSDVYQRFGMISYNDTDNSNTDDPSSRIVNFNVAPTSGWTNLGVTANLSASNLEATDKILLAFDDETFYEMDKNTISGKSHTYSTSGVYFVTVVVLDGRGFVQYKERIEVHVYGVMVVVSDPGYYDNTPVFFFAYRSLGSKMTFDAGDGTVETLIHSDPNAIPDWKFSHIYIPVDSDYDANGVKTYEAKFTVEKDGQQRTQTISIPVRWYGPKLEITGDDAGVFYTRTPLTYDMTGSYGTTAILNCGDGTTRAFDNQDTEGNLIPGKGTSWTCTQEFLKAGTKTISLRVFNEHGDYREITREIDIQVRQPIVNVTYAIDPDEGYAPASVEFDLTQSWGDYARINFGDGQSIRIDGEIDTWIVNHIYYESGVYDITVTVYGEAGTVNAVWFENIIIIDGPIVLNYTPKRGLVPLTVEFDATGTYGYPIELKPDLDSDFVQELMPDVNGRLIYQHTYTEVGSYIPRLTVTLNKTKENEKTVIREYELILASSPSLTVQFPPGEGYAPYEIVVDATGSSVNGFLFDPGDGSSEIWQHRDDPVFYHTYTQPGEYEIVLYDDKKESVPASKIIVVKALEGFLEEESFSGYGPLTVTVNAEGKPGQPSEASFVRFYPDVNDNTFQEKNGSWSLEGTGKPWQFEHKYNTPGSYIGKVVFLDDKKTERATPVEVVFSVDVIETEVNAVLTPVTGMVPYTCRIDATACVGDYVVINLGREMITLNGDRSTWTVDTICDKIGIFPIDIIVYASGIIPKSKTYNVTGLEYVESNYEELIVRCDQVRVYLNVDENIKAIMEEI